MYRSNTMQIDGQKLTRIITHKGMTKAQISLGMGFSENYISKATTYNKITPSGMKLLEQLYGITYDDIKPQEQHQTAPDTASGITDDKLYQIIKQAILDALNA